MKSGDGWMLLGGIDDVSVCNLENELPKRERERRGRLEREGEVRRSSEEGSEANIKHHNFKP